MHFARSPSWRSPTTSLLLAEGQSGGICQLGYAAVQSAGIKDRGDIRRNDIAKVTQQYNWNLGMFERTAAGQEAVRNLLAEWRE